MGKGNAKEQQGRSLRRRKWQQRAWDHLQGTETVYRDWGSSATSSTIFQNTRKHRECRWQTISCYTINDDDITCAENTQMEPTWNANVQLTPITNEQWMPVTYNVQRSPKNNMQQTPISNDVQQTWNVQRDSMESLNMAEQHDTLQTSLTELVRYVLKGPQNNETPRTYQTPTLTNALTPIVANAKPQVIHE